MCEIIIYENDKQPCREILEYLYHSCLVNRDGFGAIDECGRIKKSLYDPKTIVDFVSKSKVFAFHSRLRTVGEVSIANVHPFKIKDNLYLMHNGSLSFWDQAVSDTCIFAKILSWIDETKKIKWILERTDGNFALIDTSKKPIKIERYGSFYFTQIGTQGVFTTSISHPTILTKRWKPFRPFRWNKNNIYDDF